MHERDLCNFYFFVMQYMGKAFSEDNFSESGLKDNARERGGARDRGVEEGSRGCLEQGERVKMEGAADWEGGGLGGPLRSSAFVKPVVKIRDYRDPPPAGVAIKAFVKDVLPEMASLLTVLERWVLRQPTINTACVDMRCWQL